MIRPKAYNIAKLILSLSQLAHHPSNKHVLYKVNEIKKCQLAPQEVSRAFREEEIDEAISTILAGKAVSPERIFLEFLKQAGSKVK